MSLLAKFAEMQRESVAAEQVKVAQAEIQEQEEVIAKYAYWAEAALVEKFGEGNFTAEDVEKEAITKMEEDAYDLYMREKVAEAYEMGQIMYAGFKAAAQADNSTEE